MTEPLIFLDGPRRLSERFIHAHALSARTGEELEAAWREADVARCIGEPKSVVKVVSQLALRTKRPHRLLVLDDVEPPDRDLLIALFADVVFRSKASHVLALDPLVEALDAPNAADLFIGATHVPHAKAVVLIRGDLRSLVVPESWFTSRSGGPRPRFEDLEIIDGGQTVRLGDYEAANDAILYELDAPFRRMEKKRRIQRDESLGGSIRRLRLQRGLGRDAFPGLEEKTIARIERGEVKKPRAGTLKVIAATLRVAPNELGTF